MGVTTTHTSLVKLWARVSDKQRANSSCPHCPSPDCLMGPFGSCFNFSLSFLHLYRVRHGNTRQWECTPSNQQMCWEEPGHCPSGRPMSPHLLPEPLGRNTGRRMVPLLKGQKEAVGVGCRGKQAWLHLKYILHVWCELTNSLARLVGIGLSV